MNASHHFEKRDITNALKKIKAHFKAHSIYRAARVFVTLSRRDALRLK